MTTAAFFFALWLHFFLLMMVAATVAFGLRFFLCPLWRIGGGMTATTFILTSEVADKAIEQQKCEHTRAEPVKPRCVLWRAAG
jgi:hypothetical protein